MFQYGKVLVDTVAHLQVQLADDRRIFCDPGIIVQNVN